MKLQKRKTLVPLAGMLCVGLLTTALSADQSQRSHTHKEQKDSSYYGTTKTKGYQRDSHKMITPNAGPKVSGGMDIFVSANYIYWRANLVNSTTLRSGIRPPASAPANASMNEAAPQGEVWTPFSNWSSGFKVAAGMDTSHDGFDIRADYTWNRFTKEADFNLSYLNGSTVLNALGTHAQLFNNSNWKLDYNKVDLELGRNYKLSPNLELRSHAGLTGTWQIDREEIRQHSDANNLDGFAFPGNVRVKNHVSTWGIGPRVGSNFFWAAFKEFGIYSNVAASALWRTNYENTSTVSVYNGTTEVTTLIDNVKNPDNYGVNWVTEFELG
ncbi:hypothetical protein COB21_06000, partial [Candidatus Aerophobetes bacterium]